MKRRACTQGKHHVKTEGVLEVNVLAGSGQSWNRHFPGTFTGSWSCHTLILDFCLQNYKTKFPVVLSHRAVVLCYSNPKK